MNSRSYWRLALLDGPGQLLQFTHGHRKLTMISRDQEGRKVWRLPTQFAELGPQNFRLVTLV